MGVLVTIISVIVAISAILLILLVIAQTNRGSDIGLFGGSAEMVFGSSQMSALSKITMGLATVMIVGVFFIGFIKSYVQRSQIVTTQQTVEGTVLSAVKKDNPKPSSVVGEKQEAAAEQASTKAASDEKPATVDKKDNGADQSNTIDTAKAETNNSTNTDSPKQ